jgi:hypothetical protein
MKQKSSVLERIRQRTPLETKLKVTFQMHDYENWKNGEYFGDAEKYVKIALEEIEEHVRRHYPEASIDKLLLYPVVNWPPKKI